MKAVLSFSLSELVSLANLSHHLHSSFLPLSILVGSPSIYSVWVQFIYVQSENKINQLFSLLVFETLKLHLLSVPS